MCWIEDPFYVHVIDACTIEGKRRHHDRAIGDSALDASDHALGASHQVAKRTQPAMYANNSPLRNRKAGKARGEAVLRRALEKSSGLPLCDPPQAFRENVGLETC